MTFLPIVERELRVRARRGFTYWIRVYVGLLGIFICLVQFVLGGTMVVGVSTAGSYAFNALVASAFMLCCGACLMTATAISSERIEGTLPLLFLTRVKSNDVLLGKLLPASMAGLCALGAFLPVLMIPVLSGGVTGGETFRSALVLVHLLFLALVLGLRASTRASNWLASVRGAILLMLGWLFLPFIVEMFLPIPWTTISLASPLRAILLANDSIYHNAPVKFWIGVGVLQAVTWGLMLNTGARLRDSLGEPAIEPLVPAAPPVINSVANWPETFPFHRSIGEGDPLQWLVRRQRGVRSTIWFGAIVGALHTLVFGTLYSFAGSGFAYLLMWPVNLAMNVLESCLFAWAVTRFFVQARQSGELELVGTTPQGARLLVTAQRLAMNRLFRGPVILMLIPIGLQALFWLFSDPWGGESWRLKMALWSAISVVHLLIGVAAIIWVGIWAGLTGRSQGKAVLSTVWWVTILPALVSWGGGVTTSIVRVAALLPDIVAFLLPSLTVIALYVWLIRRTKRLLAGELRDAELLTGGLFSKPSEWRGKTLNAIRRARHWTPS